MTECNICTEKFNKTNHKKVKCQYCVFEACRNCCETYILGETKPHCMNNECEGEWTRQFLKQEFTQVFINGKYKKHREDVLFNIERSLLPATQPIVEAIVTKDRIQTNILGIRYEIAQLENQIRILHDEYRLADRIVTGRAQETVVRAQFVRACPDSECRGFLSTQWKCGICEKWTCPECHEIKGSQRDGEHECNPENVATAQLLSQDTKPCPNCKTGIFKIDGCDQMWCTQCHTAFSWRTGRIENVVHNPHYYEWMRRNAVNGVIPRNPGDIVGGGGNHCPMNMEITHNTANHIADSILRRFKADNKSREEANQLVHTISSWCRRIIHLRHNEMVRYRYDYLRNNQYYRIEYMRNRLSEEKFKTIIQQNNKKHEKNREILNILTLLYDTCTDIILRFCQKIQNFSSEYSIEELSNELVAIVTYSNECFIDIARTYSSKPLQMCPTTLRMM
jgi:hypothetical protein